jgi:hypothetical protein
MNYFVLLPAWGWFALLLLFPSTPSFSKAFVWPDGPDGRRYRIDLSRALLEWELAPNHWEPVGPVRLVNVDEHELPPAIRLTCLPGRQPHLRYLLVDCTGQVYRFDTRARTLERLDRTYFRGYNCFASRFLRRDTLYAFGGYGFWHTHNILTYYKANAGEWESLNLSQAGPPSVYHGVVGYLPERDVFLAALTYRESDSEQKGRYTYDYGTYLFDFKHNTWRQVGTLSATARRLFNFDLGKEASFVQSGRYFLIPRCESAPLLKLYVVDAVENKLYEWEDTRKEARCWYFYSEDQSAPAYVWRDTVYHFAPAEAGAGSRLVKRRVAIAQLLREARYVGSFYEPSNEPLSGWQISGVVGLVGLSVAGWWWLKHRSKTHSKAKTGISDRTRTDFEPLERRVLNALLAAPAPVGVSSDELNDLLGTEGKTIENQRRIRADMVNGLNLKLRLLTGYENAIERNRRDVDRRQAMYLLRSEVHKWLTNAPD